MGSPSHGPVPRVAPLSRRSLLAALAVAWALVLFRNVVFIAFEGSFFDSDQAIVGLMAKHLAEGRAFPLFYYGQSYMLGVDAFVAAPVFLVAGPTVGALHAALTIVNLAAVTLVMIGLVRWGGLSPWLALLSTTFFTLAPPVTAKSLIEAGANIGPFLYVPLLWWLRGRPLWWGCVLAVGFLHREFTVYAVPVLIAGDMLSTRGRITRALVERWALALVATLACWQAIQALTPYADLMGPATRGQLLDGFIGSQGGNIADRVSLTPSDWPARAAAMATDHLPRLFGITRVAEPVGAQGHDWLLVPVVFALVAAALRAVALQIRQRRVAGPTASFGWYLAGVGTVAILAYVVTRPAGPLVDRYLLLGLFLPVGIAAAFFTLESSATARRLVAAILVVWSVSAAVDHSRLIVRHATTTEPDEIRELADALVARGIRVAEADYWRAYKVTFLTREQVVVASTDFVRIAAYQEDARRAGSAVRRISETPCDGGEAVSRWYLCP